MKRNEKRSLSGGGAWGISVFSKKKKSGPKCCRRLANFAGRTQLNFLAKVEPSFFFIMS